jgi:hypothetical protein
MNRARLSALFFGFVVVALSLQGCSKKSREQFQTGVRIGKATGLCATPRASCSTCGTMYDATFSGTMSGSKCSCASTTASYATAGPAQETAQHKIIAKSDPKVSLDLPIGYRVVSGLSNDPSNFAQARSEDGFGDRFITVNAARKTPGVVEPFDQHVDARIALLRKNVGDTSTAPGLKRVLPSGTAKTFEIQVTAQNARMLVTFLETKNYYHEIKAWSVAATFPQARAELDTVAGLVHEAN